MRSARSMVIQHATRRALDVAGRLVPAPSTSLLSTTCTPGRRTNLHPSRLEDCGSATGSRVQGSRSVTALTARPTRASRSGSQGENSKQQGPMQGPIAATSDDPPAGRAGLSSGRRLRRAPASLRELQRGYLLANRSLSARSQRPRSPHMCSRRRRAPRHRQSSRRPRARLLDPDFDHVRAVHLSTPAAIGAPFGTARGAARLLLRRDAGRRRSCRSIEPLPASRQSARSWTL